jgi:hypothetical protein
MKHSSLITSPRRLLLLFLSLLALQTTLVTNSSAQSDPEHIGHCGVSASFIAAAGYDPNSSNNSIAGPMPATSFPSSAVFTCGKFKVYCEDFTLSYQKGFADPTYGPTRCSTLCAVLSYIQSVFDFSAMGSNDYIRILVNKSRVPVDFETAPGTMWLARSAPGYDETVQGVTNGWIYDYATTGNEPTGGPDLFHAQLFMNFHATWPDVVNPEPIDYQESHLGTVDDCQYDLYSVLLHEMGHMMGFFSYVEYTPLTGNNILGAASLSPAVTTANIFSGLDYSQYVGRMRMFIL